MDGRFPGSAACGLPNPQRLFPLRVDDVTSMNIFEGILSDEEECIDTLRPRSGWSASSRAALPGAVRQATRRLTSPTKPTLVLT